MLGNLRSELERLNKDFGPLKEVEANYIIL